MLLEELKIGDIVVLKNATETNYFALYLGNTSVKNFVFYLLDSIYLPVLNNKELLAQRVKGLYAVIEDALSRSISNARLLSVVRKNAIEKVGEIDIDRVRSWYAKSHLLDTSLATLATFEQLHKEDNEELEHLPLYAKEYDKLGAVFMSRSRKYYYISIAMSPYYIRLKHDDYELFCNGFFENPVDFKDNGYLYNGLVHVQNKANWLYLRTDTNNFDLLRKMQAQASYHKKYNE